MRHLYLFAILLSGTLVACQERATVRQEAGAPGVQPTSFVLERPLEIPPGQARLLIQHGRAIFGTDWDQYDTTCFLEIDSVDHEGHPVAPDTFVVTGVRQSVEDVVRLPAPLRVAGRIDGLMLVQGIDGSKAYHKGYRFELHSPRQPEVRRLSCYGSYAEPYELYAPTLREIALALGELGRLY